MRDRRADLDAKAQPVGLADAGDVHIAIHAPYLVNLASPDPTLLERSHEVVTSFRGPIELVWGTRDPVLGRVLGYLERLLPQARVTRTDAGHFLQEEVPGPIADAIRRVVAATSTTPTSTSPPAG